MASDELEVQLRKVVDPRGGDAHRRERERAIQYLLAHPAEAHPRLMAVLRSNPTAPGALAIIEMLPRFGNPESVPLLEEILLSNAELPSRAAGEALGRHPDQSARAALLRALRSPQHETLVGALDGLLVRQDRSAAEELRPLLANPDSAIRYRAVRTACSLHLLKRGELTAIARADSDSDIRSLARELASAAAP